MTSRLLSAVAIVATMLPLSSMPAEAVSTACDSRPDTEIPADAVLDEFGTPTRFLADVDGDGHHDVITGYRSGNPDPDLADYYLHVELASGWGTQFDIRSIPDWAGSPLVNPARVVTMSGQPLIVVDVQSTLVGGEYGFFAFRNCALVPAMMVSGEVPSIWTGIGPAHSEWFTCRADRVEWVQVFAATEEEFELFPDIYPSGVGKAFLFDGTHFRAGGGVDLDLPRPREEVRADFPDCSEFQGTFVDDDGSVFQGSIEWLAWRRITSGCNPPANDRFCPADRLTRGEMAAFLVRALGLTDPGAGDLFTDDDASVFEGAIDKLGTAGITKGCNPPANDRFCPDRRVTRGEMAAFLTRALELTDDGGGNLFTDDDRHVFESSIDRLGAAGITTGCNPPANDRFCPDDYVTRGQMAAFLKRALG